MKDLEAKTITAGELEDLIASIQARDGALIDAFHRLFYHSPTWSMASWQGVPILKNPCDLLMIQEIVYGIKPSLIVETGTAYGGSALYLAHLCDMNGRGEVISIDVDQPAHTPKHPRIRYVTGSSVDPAIVADVRERAFHEAGPVMVLLDSDHHAPHVSAELAAYAPIVTPRSFLIVEDTNVNGRPILPAWGPGPGEAVDAFLAAHPEFARERQAERYLLTMFPGGWLRRVA